MESGQPDEVIKRSIRAIEAQGVQTTVGPVSTEIRGDDDAVWQSLRAAYEAALADGGEVAMTLTITNSRP